MSAPQPVFYYDFNSPYAYFAAQRVDDVLPVEPRWQPFSFGFLLLATKRVPWSLGPERKAGMIRCEAIANERGLPTIRWPEGWPSENYSIAALRGALVAQEHSILREYSLAAFNKVFVDGEVIKDAASVAQIGAAVGIDPDLMRDRINTPEIKQRLRDVTDLAVERGLVGVPTVEVGDQLFWGDDQLDGAAAAISASE